MARSRTITAPSGSDAALKATVAASEPKRATLGQVVADAFGELPDASLAIVDYKDGKVAIHPHSALSTLEAELTALNALNTTDNIIVTAAPTDPTKASGPWTLSGGYTSATPFIAGVPELFTDGTTQYSAEVTEVAAVPADDKRGGMHQAVEEGAKPSFSVSGFLNKLEDITQSEGNLAGAGRSAIALVNQTAKTIKFCFGALSSINTVAATAAGTPLAVFLGTITDTAGVERQFGE